MSTDAADAPLLKLPSRFLFRFAAPCGYESSLAGRKPMRLAAEHRLVGLAELEGKTPYAEVRMAWHESGLAITVETSGKKRAPWCKPGRLVESDGLHVWINTRPTPDMHRANRFCHHFAIVPSGSGRHGNEPFCGQLGINRAKEQAPVVEGELIRAKTTFKQENYLLECFIDSAALTGYAPKDNPQLQFTYQIIDSEKGEQCFAIGSEFPFAEDPTLWAWLDLNGPAGKG